MSSAYKFLKGLLRFSNGECSQAENLVYSSFVERVNFSIPLTDLQRSLPFLRKSVNVFADLFRSAGRSSAARTIHFHNEQRGRDLWLKYIERQTKAVIELSVDLDHLPLRMSLLGKIKTICFLAFSFPVYWRLKKSEKTNSVNLLSIPAVISQLIVLDEIVTAGTKVWYSGIYEPKGNVISLMLLEKNCEVNCFVSATPLHKYLQKICCSRLWLGNPYQKEEADKLKETLLCERIIVAPPFTEDVLEYNTEKRNYAHSIGIYTAGTWKRQERGSYFDEAVQTRERLLFTMLDDFIDSNNSVSVLLFFHPVEKSARADCDKAMRFYTGHLRNKDHFNWAEVSGPTTTCFSMVELAITVFSNTIFERLYAGFKTLIVRQEEDSFPLTNSVLHNICFSDHDTMAALISRCLAVSDEQYFRQFNLTAFLSNRTYWTRINQY